VTFVGQGKFQIWEPDRFATYREEAKASCATAEAACSAIRREAGIARAAAPANGAAGGPAPVPVLLDESCDTSPGAGGIFIDGTFGAGGYSRAILDTGAGDCHRPRPGCDRRGGALGEAPAG
jgi:hypothetical protein